ncbi:tyrosine recombinase XerC [Clostridium hydrogeniformans]|uniref:tyrosine recombinase XerC n=1 Tax=Clostridium hydrogeniformans TaxID=349933 RepID=UPI000488D43A|nr:tyrosine recombinase XerC [Clostridium hydrogeniformans]
MKYDIEIINNKNLPQYLNEFLNYLTVIKGKSENTVEGYKIDLIMFFRFIKYYKGLTNKEISFEEIPIDDVDENLIRSIKLSDLYAFISFTEKYRNNGTYARARKVATLKSFFKYLSGKAKIIDENPTLDLESPKINKRHPIYLTLDESKILLTSLDETNKNYKRDFCILTLFLNCGLRVSELRGIDIDKIKGDTLSIIGKGNKERTVYLNKACIKSIDDYIPLRDTEKVQEDEKKALFLSNKNRRISVRAIELLVKSHVKNSGINKDKCTPHKLRHTAATLMYKHGNVDIRSLQQILGHENISTTQIYTHVDNEILREAVKANPLSDE